MTRRSYHGSRRVETDPLPGNRQRIAAECARRYTPQSLRQTLRDMHKLRADIEHLYSSPAPTGGDAVRARRVFADFRDALTRGQIRAAEKKDGRWQVNAWVKQGILLGFRLGELEDMSGSGPLSFV